MNEILLLRLEAPLMAFGGISVDAHRVTEVLPYRSLLVGLFGNALGYEHREADRLNALQARLVHASRADVPGEPHRDYQTVDLGQPHLINGAWTTRGRVEKRGGGSSEGTTIRYMHYRADAVVTVAVQLAAGEGPTVEDLGAALRRPARPLFLGRKACVPARPLFLDLITASDVLAALLAAPLSARVRGDEEFADALTRWPSALGPRSGSRAVPKFEDRDWVQQVHLGRSWSEEGHLTYPRAPRVKGVA